MSLPTLGTAYYFTPKSLLKQDAEFITYCDRQELQHMISECTKFFVRKPQVQPQEAFKEFIQSYVKGESVLLRPFNNFSHSKVNRLFFVINYAKIFESFEERNGFDYLQLAKLLCSDFPREIIIDSLYLLEQASQEQMLKKLFSMNQFCKAFLFTLLFDEFLRDIKSNLDLDSLIHIMRNHYPDNTDPPYLPPQAAVFECLIKYSSERNRQVDEWIVPYNFEMMSKTYLSSGVVDYNAFIVNLFKCPKVESQITKLLNFIEKGNKRILESQRIQENEKNFKK